MAYKGDLEALVGSMETKQAETVFGLCIQNMKFEQVVEGLRSELDDVQLEELAMDLERQ